MKKCIYLFYYNFFLDKDMQILTNFRIQSPPANIFSYKLTKWKINICQDKYTYMFFLSSNCRQPLYLEYLFNFLLIFTYNTLPFFRAHNY